MYFKSKIFLKEKNLWWGKTVLEMSTRCFNLMKFYISAFCGRTGRPTDKIFFGIEAHLWGESAQKEIGAISQLGGEKITFPPKRGWHTDRQTDIYFATKKEAMTAFYTFRTFIMKCSNFSTYPEQI